MKTESDFINQLALLMLFRREIKYSFKLLPGKRKSKSLGK